MILKSHYLRRALAVQPMYLYAPTTSPSVTKKGVSLPSSYTVQSFFSSHFPLVGTWLYPYAPFGYRCGNSRECKGTKAVRAVLLQNVASHNVNVTKCNCY
jgi:hypothetical protein